MKRSSADSVDVDDNNEGGGGSDPLLPHPPSENVSRKQQQQPVIIGMRPIADSYYGWVIVFGSFLIHVFTDGFVYSFGVLSDALLEEFHSTNAEVSTILSILTGLMLATGPVASAVCNRIGCRWTTIIGAIIASIGCAASSYANSMAYLIVSVGFIMGTGFGFMYCPAIVIVTIYFERYRALATGITVCGAGAGTFIFSKMISILIMEFDWRNVFFIYSGIVLICVLCGALYRPIKFEPIYEQQNVNNNLVTADAVRLLNESDHDAGENFGSASLIHDEAAQTSNGDCRAQRIRKHSSAQQHPPFENLAEQLTPKLSANSRTCRQFKLRPVNSESTVKFGTNISRRGSTSASFRRGLSQSITDVLHAKGVSKTPSSFSVSTGYLNVKDVFYMGSVEQIPEYVADRDRFRSVTSLQSTTSHPMAVGSAQTPGRPHSASSPYVPLSKDDQQPAMGAGKAGHGPPILEEEEDENTFDSEHLEKSAVDECLTGQTPAGNKVNESKHLNGKNSGKEKGDHLGQGTEIWSTMRRLMNVSLLSNKAYLLFAISNFFTSIGFNAPPMFMPLHAEKILGFPKLDAATTVSVYGLANMLGRISFGLVSDRKLPFIWGRDRAYNRLLIYNGTLVLCGAVTCFVFGIHSYHAFIVYAFFFGFTISAYICLVSVVLVDLIGVEELTNAFGLLLFIQGVATFIGPPICGWLFDVTGRYDWTFVFCGLCVLISGLMMFAVPHRRSQRALSKDDRTNIHITSVEMNNVRPNLV